MSSTFQGHGDNAGSDAQASTTNWAPKTNFNYEATGDGVNWEHNARVYEWDGDQGEIGPEYPQLEALLFGDPADRGSQGINFAAYVSTHIQVTSRSH